MDLRTLKQTLAVWTDWDVALFELGRCLGVFEPDVTLAVDAKGTIWSENAVSNMLMETLEMLVAYDVVEKQDDQYRWNSAYNWREVE